VIIPLGPFGGRGAPPGPVRHSSAVLVGRFPANVGSCGVAAARDATGYERGTITPLGGARPWPVIADTSIAGAGRVAIGGGAHGVSLLVDADELRRTVEAEVVDVTRTA
jgi:prolyl-tRNA editing enzyme YbaK/EbsC (Cys-tRNA(Pro) deacylase)